MNTLLVLGVATIPSVVVLLASLYTLRGMLRAQEHRERVAAGVENRRISLPIRLQAYERLALLLERVSPEALLLRLDSDGLSAGAYEAVLLNAIREEWNHNLSQQIYVSQETWQEVRAAKGKVSKFISLCRERVHPDAPAVELNKVILVALVELDAHPTEFALSKLRAEASEIF